MRKIICFIIAALVVTGYSAPSSAQASSKKLSKTEKREMKAAQVKKIIDSKHFTIDVKMAYPQSHKAINLTSNYSLEIKGDSVISYLPYFGRAYNVPYGGGKGLNFSAKIDDYTVSYPKKNLTRIYFTSINDEDTYKYTIEIFDNGNSSIDVLSNQRDGISFSGDMDLVVKNQ